MGSPFKNSFPRDEFSMNLNLLEGGPRMVVFPINTISLNVPQLRSVAQELESRSSTGHRLELGRISRYSEPSSLRSSLKGVSFASPPTTPSFSGQGKEHFNRRMPTPSPLVTSANSSRTEIKEGSRQGPSVTPSTNTRSKGKERMRKHTNEFAEQSVVEAPEKNAKASSSLYRNPSRRLFYGKGVHYHYYISFGYHPMRSPPPVPSSQLDDIPLNSVYVQFVCEDEEEGDDSSENEDSLVPPNVIAVLSWFWNDGDWEWIVEGEARTFPHGTYHFSINRDQYYPSWVVDRTWAKKKRRYQTINNSPRR